MGCPLLCSLLEWQLWNKESYLHQTFRDYQGWQVNDLVRFRVLSLSNLALAWPIWAKMHLNAHHMTLQSKKKASNALKCSASCQWILLTDRQDGGLAPILPNFGHVVTFKCWPGSCNFFNVLESVLVSIFVSKKVMQCASLRTYSFEVAFCSCLIMVWLGF